MGWRTRAAAAIGMAALAGPAAAADGWRVSPAGPDRPLELTLEQGGHVAYRFACGASDVAITDYGVTGLVDLGTKQKVDDKEGSVVPRGAALMMLATSPNGTTDFQPAAAVRNPAGGWDLTIHVAKTDPAFLGLAKAPMVSLFTTGYTALVMLSKDERKLTADFVARCRG